MARKRQSRAFADAVVARSDVYVPGPRAMEGTNPVNKKLAAALSGAAVLATVVAVGMRRRATRSSTPGPRRSATRCSRPGQEDQRREHRDQEQPRRRKPQEVKKHRLRGVPGRSPTPTRRLPASSARPAPRPSTTARGSRRTRSSELNALGTAYANLQTAGRRAATPPTRRSSPTASRASPTSSTS